MFVLIALNSFVLSSNPYFKDNSVILGIDVVRYINIGDM